MLADSEIELLRNAVPENHIEFLESFADSCRFGDYLFVHAGVRPGVSLELQSQSDLRWIREPFLSDKTDHGFVVVHGHTICGAVEELPNRIGIDTGAYRTGVLTAPLTRTGSGNSIAGSDGAGGSAGGVSSNALSSGRLLVSLTI